MIRRPPNSTLSPPRRSADLDTLFLETHNGDNPPIELEKFQAFHTATRVLFKTKAGDEAFLYYGNPRVSSPRYDLSLDRKSTRLNSSHSQISYAVFCLKKKNS